MTAFHKNAALGAGVIHTHGNDISVCVELMEQCIDHMKDPNMLKLRDLLQSVRLKVYGLKSPQRANNADLSSAPAVSLVSPMDPSDEVGLNGPQHAWLLSENQGLESYMSQVIDFFNDDTIGMDDALEAWYNSFVSEVQLQSPGSSRSV